MQATSLSPFNGLNGPGRPTKRTKKVVSELMDAISTGAPFTIACQAAGITYQTFQDWRKRYPAFAMQIEQAAARGTISRLKGIEAQGKDGAWQALSWLCERRHPAEFAKPEVALNIGIQNNLNAQGANGGSFESLIVSDLEFLGLRQKEGYEHRPHERQAREVEAEVVPIDLSGALAVQGYPGAAVVSKTQAESIRGRVETADAKIEQLLKGKKAGNGEPGLPAEPTEMQPASIVWPAGGEPAAGWWSQLVSGSAERQIEKATAVKAVRRVLKELVGEGRAKAALIEFESEVVTLSDLYAALERLSGAEGFRMLLKLAGRG